MTRTQTIEGIWRSLRGLGTSALHKRVDETHPFELYAEFERPDRPGLVLFCSEKPPEARSLKSLHIEQGQRPDHKWWLRLCLTEPTLQPVFAALCRDIIAFTRSGIGEDRAAAAVLSRVERWRSLMEGERRGMTASALRGLIGELLVLESELLPIMSELDAVTSWCGPFGSAQDFVLPSGARMEVKTTQPDAATVRINGLDQLDGSGDPLTLLVVRLRDVGKGAADAETAPRLIARLQQRLHDHPAANTEFLNRLAMAGWYDSPAHEEVAVRPVGVERHAVDADFPRLTRATVAPGIEDADYSIWLPSTGAPTGPTSERVHD